MIQPGLVSVTFRKLAPAEIIALVRQAQLTGIEWGGDIHVPDPARGREVRQQTGDAGLAVAAYGSYYRVNGDKPFETVLETAVALGAPTIRVWAGGLDSAKADAAYRAAVVADSRRIGDLAARAGVTISYEWHGGTLTDTNESGQQLLREVNHPNVFTLWQPHNGVALEPNLAGLHAVLPRVTNVHVFHWWPDHTVRLPLADGADRWREYLRVLAGRDRWALMEFVAGDDPQNFLRDAATLRDWLKP